MYSLFTLEQSLHEKLNINSKAHTFFSPGHTLGQNFHV